MDDSEPGYLVNLFAFTSIHSHPILPAQSYFFHSQLRIWITSPRSLHYFVQLLHVIANSTFQQLLHCSSIIINKSIYNTGNLPAALRIIFLIICALATPHSCSVETSWLLFHHYKQVKQYHRQSSCWKDWSKCSGTHNTWKSTLMNVIKIMLFKMLKM